MQLSNLPRTDLERRGKDRGKHVYPFRDAKLSGTYAQLILPAREQAKEGQITHPALKDTWFSVKVTNFTNSGPIKRWPFPSTTVEHLPGRMPTDGGPVHIDDLGGVLATLQEAGETVDTASQSSISTAAPSSSSSTSTAAPSSPSSTSTVTSSRSKAKATKMSDDIPSVLAPEVGDLRSRKYKLIVPADLRKVLRDWTDCMVLTKTEAIRRVNAIKEIKSLSA